MKLKLLLIILIIALVSFSGCSKNSENQVEEPEENIEVEDGDELDNQSEQDEKEDMTNGDEPVSSETEEPSEEDIMTDSGTYVGQVDNNHIEIMISGVPEEIAAKVFRLDIEIRDNIEDKISPQDQVIFEYYINEDEVGVITHIEKISN